MGAPALAWPGPSRGSRLPWLKWGLPCSPRGPASARPGWAVGARVCGPWSAPCSSPLSACHPQQTGGCQFFSTNRCLPRRLPHGSRGDEYLDRGRAAGPLPPAPPHIPTRFCRAEPGSLPPGPPSRCSAPSWPSDHRPLSCWPVCGDQGGSFPAWGQSLCLRGSGGSAHLAAATQAWGFSQPRFCVAHSGRRYSCHSHLSLQRLCAAPALALL